MFESESQLFPRVEVEKAFSELNAWVSVHDIIRAARILENRLPTREPPPGHIVLTFADDDNTQSFHMILMRYLIKAFRCPGGQMLIALHTEPQILPETRSALRRCRFKPTVTVGPSSRLHEFAPMVPRDRRLRFMVIRDKPPVLELVYRPLLAWHDIVGRAFELALELRDLRASANKERAKPFGVFHEPKSDSQLRAIVEAMAFYACGHTIGQASKREASLEIGFRNVAIVGAPPFTPALIGAAREAQAMQFEPFRNE